MVQITSCISIFTIWVEPTKICIKVTRCANKVTPCAKKVTQCAKCIKPLGTCNRSCPQSSCLTSLLCLIKTFLVKYLNVIMMLTSKCLFRFFKFVINTTSTSHPSFFLLKYLTLIMVLNSQYLFTLSNTCTSDIWYQFKSVLESRFLDRKAKL